MPPHEYWIKFPNHPPERIYSRDWVELMHIVEQMVMHQYKQPFEWMIRN